MLQEYWYIAAESRELKSRRPLGRKLLNHEIVLWRDREGVPHAIADKCIHRSVPLSAGVVDADWVRCPFHGWAYNGEGKCTLIPSNGPDAPIAKNARTRSYPIEERGGYIWVYTGRAPAEERRALVIPPELTESEWIAGRTYDDIEANYTRVIEQSIDIAHIPWVHRKTIGRSMPRDGRINRPLARRKEGLTVYFEEKVPVWFDFFLQEADEDTLAPEKAVLEEGVHFDMPNHFRVMLQGMIMGLYPVPIDEGHTRVYQYVARTWLKRIPLLSSFFSWFTVFLNSFIVEEDMRVLEMQVPKRMPEDIRDEFRVRTDAAELYYRKLRAAYFKMYPYEHPHYSAASNEREARSANRGDAAAGHSR